MALSGTSGAGSVWAQPVVEVSTNVAPLLTGALVAGDLDGDGDPDLIVAGGDAQGDPATHLYRNDGPAAPGSAFAWTFTRISAPFAPVSEPTLDLGDLDSDGDLDLLVSGSGVTELYRNDGDLVFTKLAHGLPGLRRAGGIVEVINTPAARFGDLDRDGDLDLVLTGEADGEPYGHVWLNERGGTLVERIELVAFDSPSLDLGDLNGDGFLDLVVLDRPSPGTPSAALLLNTGRGIGYDERVAEIAPVTLGSARLGDADADGRLDLAVAGSELTSGAAPRDQSTVYFRVPSSGSEHVQALPASSYYADWIDFDNDGRTDLVMDGSASGSTFLRFLHNTGSGFTQTDEREGVWWGAMEMADVDSDGLQDVLLMGEVRRSGQAPERRFFFLRNTAGSNAAPTAPTIDFSVAFSDGSGGITLEIGWLPGRDDVTPVDGLSYTMRVGTSPGADDVLSAAARFLPRRGNAGFARRMTLYDLAEGPTYYVSVQALDQQHRGSAFSEEAIVRTTITVSAESPAAASAVMLEPAFPNPLATTTTLTYTLPTEMPISFGVYDVLGRRVTTLAEGDAPAGTQSAQWDATNLPPGIYLARLVTPQGTRSQRLIVAR